MLGLLPPNAQGMVLALLYPSEVRDCRLVCRDWREAVSEWTTEAAIDLEDLRKCRSLAAVAPHLNTLTVRMNTPAATLSPALISEIDPPKSLRTLNVRVTGVHSPFFASGYASFSVTPSVLPMLRAVSVMCSSLLFDASSAPLLTDVKVHFCFGPIGACTNLEVLSMTVGDRSLQGAIRDIPTLPRLVDLHLDYSAMPLQRPTMGDVVISLGGTLLHRLRSLSLQGFRAAGEGLARLQHCTALTCLHLRNEAWSRRPHTFPFPPGLRDLYVHDVDASLLQGLHSLTRLALRNDGEPVDVPIAELAMLPNLQELEVDNYSWPQTIDATAGMPALTSIKTSIPIPSPTGSFHALTILAKLSAISPHLNKLLIFSLEIDAMCGSLDVSFMRTRCLPGWVGFLNQHPTPPWLMLRHGLTLLRVGP